MKTGYLMTAVIISLTWCIFANTIYRLKIIKWIIAKYNLEKDPMRIIVDILCLLIIHVSTLVLLGVIPYICCILDYYEIIKFK